MLESAVNHPQFITCLPSMPLRRFISHYWLSLHNPDTTHVVWPDGAVDIVLQQCSASVHSWLYGTSTRHCLVALQQGSHYLGIRFQPGQSRHFITAAVDDLTDRCEPLQGLLAFSLEDVLESLASPVLFVKLDAIFEAHVARLQPEAGKIDQAIALIQASGGTCTMNEPLAAFGKSRRQFERVFLATVGVSPKLFSSITRFRRAARLVKQSSPLLSLSDVAYQSGYSDQSHMSHEFRRMSQLSPALLARSRVAFLQDLAALGTENGDFQSTPFEEQSHENLVWRNH
jgi:AraC-like DNA-binding protein